MVRLIFFIPLWFFYLLLVKLPVNALGYIMVLFTSRYRDTVRADVPAILRLWISPEDWKGGPNYYEGCLPRWWVLPPTDRYPYYRGMGSGFKSFYKYHARRNAGGGLRMTWIGGVRVNPDKIRFTTKRYMKLYEPSRIRALGLKKSGFLCWQGARAGLKFVWIHKVPEGDPPLHTVLKIGTRIEPSYALLTEEKIEKDILLQSRSFATKFLYKHEDQS